MRRTCRSRATLPNTWRGERHSLADGSKRAQASFRADWAGGREGLTLQGDLDRDEGDQPQILDGANLLARWRRELDAARSFTLQAYRGALHQSGRRDRACG